MKKKKPAAKGPDNHANIYQQVLFKYIPYWYLFLALFLIFGALAWIFIKVTPPVYESSASILIKDEKKGSEDSKVEAVLNVLGDKSIVENETEVLRSNALIGEVAKSLRLYAPIVEESGWRGMKVRSAYQTSPVVIESGDPEALLPVIKEYFEFNAQDSTVTINGKTVALNTPIASPGGSIRFLRNPHYDPKRRNTEGPSRFSYSIPGYNKTVTELAEGLVTTPTSKQSTVINIKIKDEVPRRGEDIIKQLVSSYNLNSVRKKNEIASNTLNFIEDRLKVVSKELDSVESGIQSYRARSGSVDISEQGKLYLQSVQQSDQELTRVKVQQQVLDDIEKYASGKDADGSIVPSTGNIADPALNHLVEKLSTAQSQYEKVKKTTAENNPVITSLQSEIQRTRSDIIENIGSQRKSLATNQTNLSQLANKYAGMLNALPQKERQLIDVSRQRNIKNDIYSFLLQKKEEIQYSISSALPDSYLVDVPTSSVKPVSPKKPLIAILAFILPLVLGVATITIKESFNNKVLYRTDIERLTSFPVVGEIIHENLENSIVTVQGKRNFQSEQFRQIRTALRYLGNPPGQIRKLMVTSSIQGEGKSFVSTNLAISLARSGKKVALLEMDLHRPGIHQMFDMDETEGISDYLQGKATLKDILHTTEASPNLFFLPAGHIHDEPSELLTNGKLEGLIAQLEGTFDIIVIDTAPVKAITDAYVIAPICDFTLFIVRHNHTTKAVIRQMDDDMALHNVENLAIIFNAVKSRGVGKYSYGYGYGYGYDNRTAYDSYEKKRKKMVS